MLKTFASVGAVALLLSFTAHAHAQALPTATARGSFQAGVGYTITSPDYGPKKIQGPTIFADYDIGLHFGLEADAHIIDLRTPTDIAENSYLGGVRFILPYRQRVKLYGKALAGIGNFRVLETQDNQGRFNGTYLAYSFGGGLDIPINRKIVIRAIDVEYQKWPGYNNGDGLTPMLYTFGVAYHFR
jgi:hypothetical protein